MTHLIRHSYPSEIFNAVMGVAPEALKITFRKARGLIPDQIKRQIPGGYLSIWLGLLPNGDRTINPIATVPIGRVPSDSLSVIFTEEKARRLAGQGGHITSWQSRDVEMRRYGGAILAGSFILSFSGIPEHADEAMVTFIARKLLIISHDRAMEIMDISDNPLRDIVP